ncbi:hypothetical protein A4U53_030695 [Rhizobium ruizarguesonis]|uniref:Uncharacterized protein n=1 Tax=Rhizobium ruizarguesonis TaxID=2081791 RepID=A0ACD5EMH2_9HYPH|nr:hypothetical protein [Rhizobium leguminosarum]
MLNRFILGAALGSVLTVASGFAAASFGMTSVNGIFISLFVGVVSGLSSMIGGAQ